MDDGGRRPIVFVSAKGKIASRKSPCTSTRKSSVLPKSTLTQQDLVIHPVEVVHPELWFLLTRRTAIARKSYKPEEIVAKLRQFDELTPNFGDGLKGQGGLGLRRGEIADDLDPVSEPHTPDQFWQLVMAVDAAPIYLRAFNNLEDHGKRRLVRQAVF